VLDEARIVEQDSALRQAAGQAFYNTSRFTLRDLSARASQQQLKADFEAYLDGFSPNVQDILDNFEFRNQIPRLSKADALGHVDREVHCRRTSTSSPSPVLNGDGSGQAPRSRQPRHGHDLRGAGAPLQRGEQRGGRRALDPARRRQADGQADLPARRRRDRVGTYLLYDGACGTGGMLTVAEETLQQLAEERGKQVATHLYGQEINAETYAICKADLLLKGEGDAADNIVGGPEHSTLANDAFPSREFDFMLSNPPYGKSWKTDLERMGGKGGIKDPDSSSSTRATRSTR
jgi:type I restriction enzyme M protein